MEELISELRSDILSCYILAGDGGDNTTEVEDALNTLDKLKEKLNQLEQ